MSEAFDDLSLAVPTDSLNDGCPSLTKIRALVSPVGQSTIVEWSLRKPDGTPMDISGVISACTSEESETSEVPDCGTVKVRFAGIDACETVEVDATIVDAEAGLVRVELPDEVKDFAGIYQMSFGVFGPDGKLLAVNRGLISVEPSLFGDRSASGPPTLTEIRLQARDSLGDNSLLDGVEFSDAEIVYSIVRPIQEFNESLPHINRRFTVRTFPFHYQWVNAVVANLLKIAANNYMRNKLLANHGGISVNNKDRDQPYLALAMAMANEWKQFVEATKVSMNYNQCYGQIGSDYLRLPDGTY